MVFSNRMLEQARSYERELEMAEEKLRYPPMRYPYFRDRWHCSSSPHLPEEAMKDLHY